MATDPLSHAVRRVASQLAGRDSDYVPDRELLLRYARGKRGREAEEAFAALLTRHGPMVWGVCRRVLGNAADADDAFQATFLVLSRRADHLGGVGSLAGWLHGVAVRVSRKARMASARRRVREREAETVAQNDPTTDLDWSDIRPVIDEELAQLGEKYQAPIALCYLEGRTQEEAARLLGWPEGTVSGRLHRGKELLRDRLARRGITCTAPMIAMLLLTRSADAGPIPSTVFLTTLGLAIGEAPSTVVAALATGMRRSVFPWIVGAGVACAVVGGMWYLVASPHPEPFTQRVAESYEPIRVRQGAAVLAVAVAPNGQFATCGAGSDICVWAADGKLLRRTTGPANGAAALAYSPDGKALAAAGYDGSVRVWDAEGTLRHTLADHGVALGVTFSPEGALIATTAEEGRVQVWDAATGKHRWEADEHRGSVWAAAFSPDGREVASAGGDQTVRVWDVGTGRELRRFPGLRGGAYAVSYSPAGGTLIVAADNTVLILDAVSGRELGRIPGPRTAVTWHAVAPDGRSIAYREGRTVRLWEVASSQVRLSFDVETEPTALAFGPGGRTLVVAAGDGATVWDIPRLVGAKQINPATVGQELGAADAARAYRAVIALAADPERAVPILRDHLKVIPNLSATIDALIVDLDSPDFQTRERANRELIALGAEARPALQRAVSRGSPEVQARARRILERPVEDQRLTPTQARALEILELAATHAARELLATLAARPADTALKRDATLTVARLRRMP